MNKKLFSLIIAVIIVILFALPVGAATAELYGPDYLDAGDTFTVTIWVSSDEIAGFDATVSYDSGLTYNSSSILVDLDSFSAIDYGGTIQMSSQIGTASGGSVVSMSFTATSPGFYSISLSNVSDGYDNLSGDAMTVEVAGGGGVPPEPEPTPVPEVVGPTPLPVPENTPTPIPVVTLTMPSAGETTPAVTDPETGEEVKTFYMIDGTRLLLSEEPIPDERVPAGFVRETIDFLGRDAYSIKSPVLPRLYFMTDDEGNADFYFYWAERDRFVPYSVFTTPSLRLLIVPPPGNITVPDGFVDATLTIDGQQYPAFAPDASRFRLLPFLSSGLIEAKEGETADNTLTPAGTPLEGLYLVFAKREEGILDETAEPEPVTVETNEDGVPVDAEGNLLEELPEPQPVYVEDEGMFYIFEPKSRLFFPYQMMLTAVLPPAPTPTPIPTPIPSPTPVPTIAVTVPAGDIEPTISLFGYEYGLWKSIILILGCLLLITWLIVLIRSMTRRRSQSRDDDPGYGLRDERNWARVPVRPGPGKMAPAEVPLEYIDRPPTKSQTVKQASLPRSVSDRAPQEELPLIVPSSAPAKRQADAQLEDSVSPAVKQTRPSRIRPVKLPEMPELIETRPDVLPTHRNEMRTHADEMVLRPLPSAPKTKTPEPRPASRPPDLVPSPDDTSDDPGMPAVRRIEITSRKPKLRFDRGEREPEVDEQENSEI